MFSCTVWKQLFHSQVVCKCCRRELVYTGFLKVWFTMCWSAGSSRIVKTSPCSHSVSSAGKMCYTVVFFFFFKIYQFWKTKIQTFPCFFCRWHLSWRWVVERDSTFQLPSPEILPRTINNLKTGRRVKTRIRKWRWTTWRKKEDMDAIHHLVHGRPCRKGERTMLISPKIKIGVLIYQIVTCFSLLRPIRTMLEQSLVSHPHQVFFPSHQVTGYLFLLNLLIKKWWHFSLKHYLKSRLEMEIFIF